MATVVVTVKERIATIPSGVSLVCNNPSDVIQFNFDSEWNSVTLKTARFTWQRSYVDVPFTGNSGVVSAVPLAVLSWIAKTAWKKIRGNIGGFLTVSSN